MPFPSHRARRLRATPALRRLVRETRLHPDDLALPLFVIPGRRRCEPVASMPGVCRRSVDQLAPEIEAAAAAGLPAVLLFGLPADKDETGSGAWDPRGPVPMAIREIKRRAPGLAVVTDVCLCAYTRHGHCGVLRRGAIDNDATLPLLARSALCHARAGADLVAPSDMMDGRVGAIRAALDRAGFADTGILSYAVKYASAFYGPFRDAAASAPAHGDRRSHQMDPANVREALREAAADAEEGADLLMVKPALACLDVIRAVREALPLPVAAYSVSGEYAMIKAAAAQGWVDERAVALESLGAMKRAGADVIFTYHALDAARWLAEAGA